MSKYEAVVEEFDLTYAVFLIADSLGIEFRDLTLWIGEKVEKLNDTLNLLETGVISDSSGVLKGYLA